jgi:universal stress protein E
MTHEVKINKALVVLSPDLIRPDKPMKSALLRRAVDLARITGCELELFHVCYDSKLEYQLFTSDEELEQQRVRMIDRDATLLAEIATRLKDECVKIRHEARWDNPRTDAILRKTLQSKPDIVMKQAREHSFLLGIASNTDWDLARRSPTHVWLVNEEIEGIDRIVAAVGNKFGDPADITTAADYDLFRTAGLFGETFNAEIYPVNAYQLPRAHSYVAPVEGVSAPVVEQTEQQQQLREQLVKQHNGMVRAVTKYFHIDTNNVHVREGHPNKVIPDVARQVDADMIVMGANSISRLERLVSSVTVEPVMADTNCDIVVVRERDSANLPDAEERPFYGVPKYDLEHAIINPKAAFRSPKHVPHLDDVSIDLRRRILQAWEYDIRAGMADENEGGPVTDINANDLDEIRSAQALLKEKEKHSARRGARLNSACG